MGAAQIEGIYLEDERQDTLLYARSILVDIAWKPILDGFYKVKRLDLDGIRANVYNNNDSTFNYQFLIDAFASDTTAAQNEEIAQPDTANSKSQLPFSVGKVNLTDIKGGYRDVISTINTSISLKKLQLEVNELDFDSFAFDIDQLTVDGLDFSYTQQESTPSEEPESESPLPKIMVGSMALNNLSINYEAVYDSLFLNGAWQSLALSNAQVDLANQKIQLDNFTNKQKSFSLQLPQAKDTTTTDSTNVNEEQEPFALPNWQVSINTFEFNLQKLAMNVGSPKHLNYFDANHLHFQDLSLVLADFNFSSSGIKATEFNFTVKDSNAFNLKQLKTSIDFNKNGLAVEGLKLRTANTSIEGNVVLNYQSFDELVGADFNNINSSIQLAAGTSVNLTDVYYFSPELQQVPIFDSLAQHPIKIYGQLNGTAKSTLVNNLIILYGKQTSIKTKGVVKNWMDAQNIAINLNELELNAYTKDFSFALPETYPAYYPQQLKLEGSGQYSPRKIAATFKAVVDSITRLDFDGFANMDEAQQYKIRLNAKDLALSKWLQDTASFEPTDLIIKAEGAGLEWPNLTTDAHIILPEFNYKKMRFDTLYADLKIKDDSLTLSSKYNDDKLDYTLEAKGKLDSLEQRVVLDLSLDKINLLSFNLLDSLAYARLQLKANVLLVDSSQYIDLSINELSYADENNSLLFGPLKLKVGNNVDSSYVNFDWEQIEANVYMNQTLDVLGKMQYGTEQILSLNLFDLDSTYKPVALKVDVNAALSNQLSLLLNESLQFEPLSLKGAYLSEKKKLDFELNLPSLSYGTVYVDSLSVKVKADTTSLVLENTIKKIEAGYINIFQTALFADVTNERADFKLSMLDDVSDSLFYIHATGKEVQDSLTWTINTDTLLLYAERWRVNEDNAFYINKKKVRIKSLKLSQNEQSLSIATVETGQKDGLSIDFNQFRVENFISLLNPEEVILKGMLNGSVKVQDYNNPLDFMADIKLTDILVFEKEGGEIRLEAKQSEEGRYALNIISKGPLELAGEGWIDNNTPTPEFNIDLQMQQLSLPFLAAFSDSAINEASGMLQGHFNISGNADEFTYSGDLNFKEASLLLTALNTSFKLPNEKLLLKNQTINFNNFTILDEMDNKMQLNGEINTENLLNPVIDLKLQAKDFQLMNTDDSHNETYYGKINVDANIQWLGPLQTPTINTEVTINENTNLTYVVPPSSVDIIDQEGIVRFKSPYEALDSLKNLSDSSGQNVKISGFKLDARIKTDKEAKFKVIVDQRRGDYLIISGESDLIFGLNEAGTLSLTGNYLVNEGYYQLSLYDLVKRKFEIQSGSQIKWYGSPLEAGLDITANYEVETSPASLMLDPSSTSQNRNQFRQKLPFIVKLFVNGDLTVPEISFGLSMPQEQRGALGGQVYQQIQSINNNENELNKQVFSLLVLSQFFPRGSGGTGPDSEVIARNSASQILTNQLNKLSDQYVKGFDLSVDLDSYKDYESGGEQDRTQLGVNLSKSLFNDRFKVQIGSQVDLEGQQRTEQGAADVLGNVLIEYLLTKDGTYKLTGYRKNQFEGLIEGQIVVTGISIQFNKEFDKFKDLWKINENDEE